MLNCWELILVTFILMHDCSQSLRLVEVRIPNYVIKGSTAQLECLYDLGDDALYSVKWYKDGNEFYRYIPRDLPPVQTFLLPGVSVDLHNSSDAIVTLREVNLQSAGRFRCEVSGEAPSFHTVTEHSNMIVVSLPDQGPPKISGGRPRYQIGDWVSINCTAGRSKPAVQLSWFVNGEAAEPHMLRKYDTIISGREALETSVLGLQFRVEQHHFRNGDMKLKCVASLSTFYWRSNEESVEGDRPQKAPVLESRETVYASNSRADPVQANKTDSTVVIKPITIVLLIGMILLTTTNCLENFYLNNLLSIVEKEKKKTCNKYDNNTAENEGCEHVKAKEQSEKDAQDKFKRIANNTILFYFNKKISLILEMLISLKASATNKTRNATIRGIVKLKHDVETSVPQKSLSSSILTNSATSLHCPALPATKPKLSTFNSRLLVLALVLCAYLTINGLVFTDIYGLTN